MDTHKVFHEVVEAKFDQNHTKVETMTLQKLVKWPA